MVTEVRLKGLPPASLERLVLVAEEQQHEQMVSRGTRAVRPDEHESEQGGEKPLRQETDW